MDKENYPKIIISIGQLPLLVLFTLQWEQIIKLLYEHPSHSALTFIGYELFVFAISFVIKVWNKIEGRVIDRVADSVWSAINNLAPTFFRRYKEKIIYLYGTFNVRGLGLINTYRLNLEDVFVDLRIVPSSNPSKPNLNLVTQKILTGNRTIWDFLRFAGLTLTSRLALVVIGPPGCGKTTLLQHVSLALAGNKQSRYHVRSYIPILLFLRDHVSEITEDRPPVLGELVAHHFSNVNLFGHLNPPPHWFEKNLSRGKCIVLLDGLDEVADSEKRKAVAAWVDIQIKIYPKCGFVITSRPQGYIDAALDGVDILEVQPFSGLQVKQFIHNWYLANEVRSSGNINNKDVRNRAIKEAEDLLERLNRAPALSALTVNPLLLTMIAMVHRYHGSLPGSRVELYGDICDVLLRRWQQVKGVVDPLSEAQKLLVLRPLAAYMMECKIRDINTDVAMAIIKPFLLRVTSDEKIIETFLDLVQTDSGLIVEREAKSLSFAHHTFQEYLATGYWLEYKEINRTWEELVDDSWWHETLLLYAAQSNATPIVNASLSKGTLQALMLAADCLEESRELDSDVRRATLDILIANLESSDIGHSNLAAKVQLSRRLKSLQRIDDRRAIDLKYLSCAEYQLFIDEMKLKSEIYQPDHWAQARFRRGQALEPITGIRAQDAAAFCQWLTEQQGGNIIYRLPHPDEINYSDEQGTTLATWCYSKEAFILKGLSLRVEQDLKLRLDILSTNNLPAPLSLASNQQPYIPNDLNLALTCIFDPDKEINFNFEIGEEADLALNRDLSVTSKIIRKTAIERSRIVASYISSSVATTIERIFTYGKEFGQVYSFGQDITLVYRARSLAKEIRESHQLDQSRSLVRNLSSTLGDLSNFVNGRIKSVEKGDIRASDKELRYYRNFAFDLSQARSLVGIMDQAIQLNDALSPSRFYSQVRDLERAHGLAQSILRHSHPSITQLSILLSNILSILLAPTPELARQAWRKYLSELLVSAYEGYNSLRSSAFLWKRSVTLQQNAVLQFYWWLQIIIAREEGKLPAWEGIRVVREQL